MTDAPLQAGKKEADAGAALRKKAALAEACGAGPLVLARMTGRYPPLSHLQDRTAEQRGHAPRRDGA